MRYLLHVWSRFLDRARFRCFTALLLGSLDVVAIDDQIRCLSPSAITDIGVGALLCKSAFEGAVYNIRINLLDLEDAEFRTGMLASIDELRNTLDSHCETVKQSVESNF